MDIIEIMVIFNLYHIISIIIHQHHMRLLLLTLLLTLSMSFLYTPKNFLPMDVTDGVYEQIDYNLKLETTCNNVTLNSGDYNYNGTVLSGYGKVGKNGSALAFIFYGKEGVPR